MDANAALAAPVAPAPKKAKGKKSADPVNTTKQIADTIAQLEKNTAADREQEVEIEREVKRANREVKSMLDRFETPMHKLDALHKRYTGLLTDMKRLEREHTKSKKKADTMQKERDKAQSEVTKTKTLNEKLEKLSRELQKENKRLKDDNKRMQETESRSREELHERLESMTSDVQYYIDMKEHPENQPQNYEADELFRNKFKSFIDQYEMRELQFHALLRTKELEVQYQVARYEQQRKAQEQEANKSRQLTNQVSTFSQTETELRSQLSIYVEKFKQVEDTLNNSNDLFLTFRKEMEEMSKKTKRLEKENHNLERKQAAASNSVYQMAEERAKTAIEMDLLRKKNVNLEKLCRGMQQQGRGQLPPQNVARQSNEVESEGTESEYGEEYEDEDEEGEYDEGEYDDDTEEEASLRESTEGQQPVGPVPPPPPPSTRPGATLNHDRANGQVNGIKH